MLKGLTQEHEQYCIAENAANIIKNAINWMPIIIVLFSRWNEILCKKNVVYLRKFLRIFLDNFFVEKERFVLLASIGKP